MSSTDDDALSWAGDDDATLVVGDAGRSSGNSSSGNTGTDADSDAGSAARADELPEGWTAVGAPGRSAPVADAEPDATTAAGVATAGTQSSVALVGMGILAGIYMLYTVGWYIGANRIGNPIAEPLGAFMFSLGAWLAIASPLVWFASVYWLTTTRPRLRILWLFIGVIVLAPFPFIFGVGVNA